MQTYPDCYHCILRQAVSAIQRNTTDPTKQIHTIRKVLLTLEEADYKLSPSEIAGETNCVMREELGVDDLYQAEKEAGHDLAMGYLDDLRKLAQQGTDPLEQALKISAAGNIIDVINPDQDYDLWVEVQRTVAGPLLGEGFGVFRDKLQKASHLLYLADNVGESIFDRVMIEQLQIPVYYAVKGGPILNDVTYTDAVRAGIEDYAEIVETGASSPGTVLDRCSSEFRQLFAESELILAKGQANYETLDIEGDKVFFLMRIKCPLIADLVQVPFGNLALIQGKSISQA